jgi:beta-phosphoglucomutase-like phosphatase (HAD superfamily)
MMRLQALIFDVDGTLANTEEAHRESFNEAFRLHGLDWHWTRDQYKGLLRTTGGKERMAAYVSTLALPETERVRLIADIPQLHREKTAIYTRRVNAGDVALREGVERLLEEAQAANVRLAIATTTSFENIAALLASTLGPSALDRFAAIGAGDQVERKKPAPDVYLAVLQKLNLSPEHCVAIEDSVNGLQSAKAAELFTVVTPTYWTQDEDFSQADILLPTLGSHEAPLPDSVAAQVGGQWLSIAHLEHHLGTRHEARRPAG